MSTPKSAAEASDIAARLLRRGLPGEDARVRAECDRGGRVAAAVWQQWGVGPWQWRCKHIRWFLEHGSAGYRPWTRYRYWVTVKRLLQVIGKWHHWRAQLIGPWCAPK